MGGIVELVVLLFKGAPTAISHLCPGCPCAGLRLADVFGVGTVNWVCELLITGF